MKRRVDLVQIFPDQNSVTRLIGAVLQEQHKEEQYDEGRYPSAISIRKLIRTLHEHTDGLALEL